MRTTLNIDERLIDAVVDVTGEKSKSKAVSRALEDYVRSARMKSLLDLEGKIDLDLSDWHEFRHEER